MSLLFPLTMILLVPSACLSYALSFPVIRLARIGGAVDFPVGGRHLHRFPTPKLGGLPILFSTWILILPLFLFPAFRSSPAFSLLATALCSATLVAAVGAADDFSGIRGSGKLALYALAVLTYPALFAISSTHGRENPVFSAADLLFHDVFPAPVSIFLVSLLFSAVLLCFIVAFSVADGLDGLCVGYSLVGFAGFACLFFLRGDFPPALCSLVLLFLAVGFLPQNLFRRSPRLFLGDSGSALLGFCLGVLFLHSLFSPSSPLLSEVPLTLPTAFKAVSLPLQFAALPLSDLFLTILRRLLRGRSPFSPDTDHLHHRILARGLTPAATVAILLLFAFVSAAPALLLA